MDEKLLFCVSVMSGEDSLYGPEWKEVEFGKTLVDLFLQVCGTKVLGQQVQVLVSKDRSFLEAAVVQVCSPLKMLDEKSQSYIQFVLKSPIPKGMLSSIPNVNDDKRSLNYNKLNILDTKKWNYQVSEVKTDQPSLHTLTSKASFENMTVEEICEEIKRIKSAEVSKNKLSTWMEESTKDTCPVKNCANQEPTDTPEKILNNDNQPTEKQKLYKNGKTKTFDKLTESAKNKLANSKKLEQQQIPKSLSKPTISDRLSVLAQPRRRSVEVKNLEKGPSQLSSRRSVTSKKPLNRKLLPETSMSKVSTKKNTSPSMTRGSSINSTFIKTGVKITRTPKGNSKKSTTNSTEYFVEIFTKEKTRNKSLKAFESKSVANKRKTDYSNDSLMDQSKLSTSSKSISNEETSKSSIASEEKCNNLSMSEMLSQFQCDRLENLTSQSPLDRNKSPHPEKKDIKEPEIKTKETPSFTKSPFTTPEGSGYIDHHHLSGGSSPEDVIFDKSVISTNEKTSNGSKQDLLVDNLEDTSDEKLKNIAKDILNDTSSISIMIDEHFSLDASNSPTKKSFFSPILQKNNIMQNGTSTPIPSRSKSEDNIQIAASCCHERSNISKAQTSRSFDSLEELKASVTTESVSEESFTSKSNHVDKNPDYSIGQNIDTDHSVMEPSASSRMKFTEDEVEKTKCNGLNRTFILNEINSHVAIVRDVTEQNTKEASNLPINDSLSLPLLKTLKTPEKPRKHWGNSIEGMDNMLIPSLEAFSLELRGTTENVATNIRTLYEDWQVKYDGLDILTMKSKPFPKAKSSPRSKTVGGEQQGIAVVFRNLRKMELKLKTIEQATAAMAKELEEVRMREKTEGKDDVQRGSGLHRAKSFKWTELKNTARNQTRSKSWMNHGNNKNSSLDCSSDDSD